MDGKILHNSMFMFKICYVSSFQQITLLQSILTACLPKKKDKKQISACKNRSSLLSCGHVCIEKTSSMFSLVGNLYQQKCHISTFWQNCICLRPLRTGRGGFYQFRSFLPITSEVISVHSRTLVTFLKFNAK